MPNNLTDADAYTTPVQAPADGDAVGAAIADLGHQHLANRTNYMYRRALASGAGRWYVPLNDPAHNPAGPTMIFNNATYRWYTNTVIGLRAVWALIFPAWVRTDGVGIWRIDNMGAWAINMAGHGGLAPVGADRQAIRIVRQTPSTNAIATVAELYDPSNAATLDTLHNFDYGGGIAHTLASDRTYWLEWETEAGANAKPQAEIGGIYLDFILV